MSLHRYRFPLSALFLLVILYFIGFTLWTIPPVSVAVGWQPETTLVVMPDIEGTYPALQEGYVVLSINGQPVQRGERLFPFPTPPAYLFTLERDGQIVTQLIPVADSTLFHLLTLPAAVLAVAFWIIGIFTVWFANPRETNALYAGYSWQLIGAGLVSVGPFKTGAPGAWIVAGFPAKIDTAFINCQKAVMGIWHCGCCHGNRGGNRVPMAVSDNQYSCDFWGQHDDAACCVDRKQRRFKPDHFVGAPTACDVAIV